jgi:polysaccharide deacetylase family protein (PEP-CTERM system associated)
MSNLLGIDFEEWYHPEFIQKFLENKKHPQKIFQGIDKIIDFLRKFDTNATFFMVGEILESHPEILDKILENGHEIGFHTMYHTRLDEPNFKKKFSEELQIFQKLTNKKSKGFRAPTFSLNEKSAWAIDELILNGYKYDSSIVPAKMYLYGNSNAETIPYQISKNSLYHNDQNSSLTEYPLMITKFFGKKIPAGGGFYLRTLPLKIIKNAIQNYEKEGKPATFYIHSWELTPEYMPEISLPAKEKFVTYHNLKNTMDNLGKILKSYEFTSFESLLN